MFLIKTLLQFLSSIYSQLWLSQNLAQLYTASTQYTTTNQITFIHYLHTRWFIYLALFWVMFRVLLISWALGNGANLADYYYLDGIYTVATQQYAFLRFPYALRLLVLIAAFLLYIDYVRLFKLLWALKPNHHEAKAIKHYISIAYSISTQLDRKALLSDIWRQMIKPHLDLLQPINSMKILLRCLRQIWTQASFDFSHYNNQSKYPKLSNQLLTRTLLLGFLLEWIGGFLLIACCKFFFKIKFIFIPTKSHKIDSFNV